MRRHTSGKAINRLSSGHSARKELWVIKITSLLFSHTEPSHLVPGRLLCDALGMTSFLHPEEQGSHGIWVLIIIISTPSIFSHCYTVKAQERKEPGFVSICRHPHPCMSRVQPGKLQQLLFGVCEPSCQALANKRFHNLGKLE